MAIGQPLSFGALLRRYRLAAGLTQEALAERAGLSERGISDLERGVNRAARPITVALLAEALTLSAQERAAFEATARGLDPPAVSGAPLSQRAGLTPPLVGRVAELALLDRHLAGEGPPVLLLAGEPGIGKSCLLQEAAQRAVTWGWTVLQGGCQRRGSQEPYAPLLTALERHVRHQSPPLLKTELAGCAWLVRLLPELAAGPIEPLPAWTLSPEQELRLMFAAVGRFLANAAGPAGTLLVLDDLQWAGADALDLLATLMRAAEAPLRVVGAYRDTEVAPQDPLSMALADLAHARLTTQRTLVPLAAHEVTRLLSLLLDGAREMPAELREGVLQRAGGVPFFVVSCAYGLRDGALAVGAEAALPWDLAQSLRQRVAVLSEPAREVLGAAAVIGRPAPPALLMAVTGRPEHEVLAALDACCRARLLVEEGPAYRCAHDVIREVVEADLGTARRQALHRRVVRALEDGQEEASRPGSLIEQLAYHSRQAGEARKAIHYARLAGDRAMGMFAYRDAVAQYEVALELLPADDPRARAELLTQLGEAADPLGDTGLQVRYWQEARQLYAQIGDRRKVGDVSWRLALVYRQRGDSAAALEHLHAALTVLEAEPPGRELAATYSTLSQLCMVMMQFSESIDWGQKALDLAAVQSDAGITANALNNMGAALMFMGDVERGREHLERALEVAKDAALADATTRAYNNLGYGLLCLGEYRRAGDTLRAGLAMADRTGWVSLTDHLLSNLGGVEMELGHWDEARRLLAQASRRSEASDSVQRVWSVLRTGELMRRLGRLDDAAQMLEGILPACENFDDSESLGICLASLALVRLARGDRDGAVAAMDQCIARWQRKGAALGYDRALWHGIEVYLQAGRAERTTALLETLVALADSVATPAACAYAAEARGLLAAYEDQHDEAAVFFQRAAERWHEMGCPYQEARARRYYAENVLHTGAAGARGAAERELIAAREVFERLDARAELEAVATVARRYRMAHIPS